MVNPDCSVAGYSEFTQWDSPMGVTISSRNQSQLFSTAVWEVKLPSQSIKVDTKRAYRITCRLYKELRGSPSNLGWFLVEEGNRGAAITLKVLAG
jgi:hypothetical protein